MSVLSSPFKNGKTHQEHGTLPHFWERENRGQGAGVLWGIIELPRVCRPAPPLRRAGTHHLAGCCRGEELAAPWGWPTPWECFLRYWSTSHERENYHPSTTRNTLREVWSLMPGGSSTFSLGEMRGYWFLHAECCEQKHLPVTNLRHPIACDGNENAR